MTYCVYGFRLPGDVECRYIGMTGASPRARLINLTNTARTSCRARHPDGLNQWLLDNHEAIETFEIMRVETDVEARAVEKAMIAFALQLGQRLLNVQHVPDQCRIGYVPTGWSLGRRAVRSQRVGAA